jgi:hypothetical protein
VDKVDKMEEKEKDIEGRLEEIEKAIEMQVRVIGMIGERVGDGLTLTGDRGGANNSANGIGRKNTTMAFGMPIDRC